MNQAINHIEVRLCQPNTFHDPHRCVFIDGARLDVLLAQRTGVKHIEGLVPTALPWFSQPADRDLVWERLLPHGQVVGQCPLLMCPDDMDFYCTLVVARVTRQGSYMIWSDFSLDFEEIDDPLGRGQGRSSGLSASIVFVFDAVQYEEELLKFELEEEMWQEVKAGEDA